MANDYLDAAVRNQAIERMMDAYGTATLRMCYAFLKDYPLAEDAAQDTFVKAYRGLDGFLGKHGLSEKAWILRIAINTCKDYKRTAWFRHIDKTRPVEEVKEAQCLSDTEDQALLEEVMALPMKLKEVVLLHYYQGLMYQEIMQALGISKSSVYDRLEKAKRKLRGALEGWDSDEG